MERDRFMGPQQALEYGLIDKVLDHPPQASDKTEDKDTSSSGTDTD